MMLVCKNNKCLRKGKIVIEDLPFTIGKIYEGYYSHDHADFPVAGVTTDNVEKSIFYDDFTSNCETLVENLNKLSGRDTVDMYGIQYKLSNFFYTLDEYRNTQINNII